MNIRTAKGHPINITFLNQNSLIQRELVSALRRLPDARVITIDITSHPSVDQVSQAIELMRNLACRVLVTVNEWGIDAQGAFWEFLDREGIVHLNWSVDDPFFEEIILARKFRPSLTRFDFVSDKGYVEPMRTRGYNAHFLPLAVDPSIFHPDSSIVPEKRYDSVFVGNSYLAQMDELLKGTPDGFIDTLVPFLGEVVRRYHADVEYDVEGHINRELRRIRLPEGISFDLAHFIAKHAAGYLGRKQIVLALAHRYPAFMVFGEPGWLKELPRERVGTAKYYDALCDVYRRAKITIDINRMVIRNGFTQRVFDVLAAGGFVITSAKPVVSEFFETEGPRQEIALFRNQKELMTLIDHFLANEKERLAISERGRAKVLAFHTYDHRVAEMFSVASRKP